MNRLVLLSLLFVPIFFQAQNDVVARAFFDKTISTLQQNVIQTDFVVIYENSVNSEKETKQGKLVLKGNKFRFLFDEMDLFYNGKTQWLFQKNVDEVTISEPSGKELNEINPIFMVKAFRATHDVQFDADDDVKAHNRMLNLYPRDKSVNHFKVALVVKNTTKQIVSIKIFFKNGTSTFFTTKNYMVLKVIDESIFVFDASKYTDVIINDLR